MNNDASIIISSFNSQSTIRKCLSSLLQQDYPGLYEIIVMDSSKDNTPYIINNEFPSVKLYRFRKRTFPGRCRNKGIQLTNGDHILFLPADCYVPKDWLRRRIEHHRSGYKIVSSSIDNGNPHRLIGWIEFFSEFTRQLHEKNGCRRIIINQGYYYLSYSRKLFTEIGNYDENLLSGEDTDFLTRILSQKIPIFYDPAIVFFHLNNSSFSNSLRHQFIHGRDSGKRNRKQILIDGNFRFKYLLILYYPIIKWFIIGKRVCQKNTTYIKHFILLSPLIYSALTAYALGYLYGYTIKKQ